MLRTALGCAATEINVLYQLYVGCTFFPVVERKVEISSLKLVPQWLKTVLRDGEFSSSTSRCSPAIFYWKRNGPSCGLQHKHLLLSVKPFIKVFYGGY
jgi:hypothetical protein